MTRLIKKIIKNHSNGQLLITIPKDSDFSEGDYVEIKLVPELGEKE